MMSMLHTTTGALAVTVLLWASPSAGFSPLSRTNSRSTSRIQTPQVLTPPPPPASIPSTVHTNKPAFLTCPLFQSPQNVDNNSNDKLRLSQRFLHRWKSLQRRLEDTTSAAGITDAKTAGVFGKVGSVLKKVHDPKTYLAFAAFALLRWDWCFKNMFFWFGVGFCIKWYRARYVFKIPVWDRQPNWNNVITSKDQEKDLKAFTCKNCGSTIFIAKTREFFFEGKTGIGGLGCFSCGAKGNDNFIMDRDRIVEDVADVDDYFDYEQPLDFVSRAERRKLLKEAKGDEELANKMLMERNNAGGGASSDNTGTANGENTVLDADLSTDDNNDDDENPVEAESAEVEETAEEEETTMEVESVEEVEEVSDKAEPTEAPKAKKAPEKKAAEEVSDDDLDILGI